VKCELTAAELRDLRTKAGYEGHDVGGDPQGPHPFAALPELLAFLPILDAEGSRKRANLLWEATEGGRSTSAVGAAFSGSYSWTYYQPSFRYVPTPHSFDSSTRLLGCPTQRAHCNGPEFVVFESLGWEENPVLTSKIRFKPPIIDQLALEAGIEAQSSGDVEKGAALTSVAELLAALGEEEQPEPTTPTPTASEGTDAPGTDSPRHRRGCAQESPR